MQSWRVQVYFEIPDPKNVLILVTVAGWGGWTQCRYRNRLKHLVLKGETHGHGTPLDAFLGSNIFEDIYFTTSTVLVQYIQWRKKSWRRAKTKTYLNIKHQSIIIQFQVKTNKQIYGRLWFQPFWRTCPHGSGLKNPNFFEHCVPLVMNSGNIF